MESLDGREACCDKPSPPSCTTLAYYLHNLDPFIFHVTETFGPRWYGMAYVMAFICGYALLAWLSKRGYADLHQAQVGDFITWAALFGVMVGGRLGYVLFYKPEMLAHPLSIVKIWEGGMSSHGGIIGLVLFTLYYSRKYKISWTNLGDNFCVVAPIGLFFGRCANFINGELYGRPAKVAWAVQFPKELLEPENAAQAERAVALAQQIDPGHAFDRERDRGGAIQSADRANPAHGPHAAPSVADLRSAWWKACSCFSSSGSCARKRASRMASSPACFFPATRSAASSWKISANRMRR